jgi:hypothetical protein
MTEKYTYCVYCGEKFECKYPSKGHECEKFLILKNVLQKDVANIVKKTNCITNIYKQIYSEINDRLPNFYMTKIELNEPLSFIDEKKPFGLMSINMTHFCQFVGETRYVIYTYGEFYHKYNLSLNENIVLVGFTASEPVKMKMNVYSYCHKGTNHEYSYEIKKNEFVYAIDNKYVLPYINHDGFYVTLDSENGDMKNINCIFAIISPKLLIENVSFTILQKSIDIRLNGDKYYYLITRGGGSIYEPEKIIYYDDKHKERFIKEHFKGSEYEIVLPSCEIVTKPKRKMRKLN